MIATDFMPRLPIKFRSHCPEFNSDVAIVNVKDVEGRKATVSWFNSITKEYKEKEYDIHDDAHYFGIKDEI